MNLKSLYLLLRNVKIKSFKKGEIIITQYSLDKSLFYIRKGIVRCYITSEKVDEVTFQLFAETNVFTNIHAVLFNEPSKFLLSSH